MAILTKGVDFTTGDQVTANNLDNLVDAATFASGAVDGSTTQLSGGAIIVKDLGVTAAKLENATNGQLMIGNGAGFTKAALTAGTNIAVTNASGAVTLGLTGTVAAANGGTGLSAAGTSGNILTSNGTTWTSAIPSGGISSAGATITTNTTLTAASPGYQPIAMTALGQSVTLPDATTVLVGSPKFYLNNASGGYPVGIRNTSGTLLMAIGAGGTAFVSCQDITTAAGVWNITGDNLEAGLITLDSVFSSTYSSTVLAPFVAFDTNISLHFVVIATGGFAAVAVNNTTGAVGTPLTISATASMVPKQVFKITSTTAVVFYSADNDTLIAAVITLSGTTTLAVGTASSTLSAVRAGIEDFKSAPKIAALDTTLYLVSYATATGAGTTSVAAFQVSGGTTVTLGSAVNIIASNNCVDSTATYAITALTGFVSYKSGAAAPYANSGVVVSVTNANPPVCTVGTPATLTGVVSSSTAAPMSCQLTTLKYLIGDDNNVSGTTIVSVFTVSGGTTVTAGTAVSLFTGGISQIYTTTSATRYNPHLFTLTSTTALVWFFDNNSATQISVLSEASGTVTKGSTFFTSLSSTTLGKMLMQGTAEFVTFFTASLATDVIKRFVPHKISGTTITTGIANSAETSLASVLSTYVQRMTSGDYVLASSVNPSLSKFTVFKNNGSVINVKGTIAATMLSRSSADNQQIPAVASNRLVILGSTAGGSGTTVDSTTNQVRLINVEIAA